MNKLQITGTQRIIDQDIPIIEGGFGEGQKCILVRTIAEIHGVELKDINRLINSNINEFENGVDILDLKINGGFGSPLLDLGFSNRAITISKNIYLLSEQGYFLLVSFMKTEIARIIRKQMRREYFQMREQIKQVQVDSYMIEDPILRAEKWLEEARYTRILSRNVDAQKQIIKEYKPKADFCDDMLRADGLFTITQIAQDFGLSAASLNKKLQALKVQYKQSGQWLLYSQYKGKNYVQGSPTTVYRSNGDEETKLTTKWTMKGRAFIYVMLKSIGIYPVVSIEGKQTEMEGM